MVCCASPLTITPLPSRSVRRRSSSSCSTAGSAPAGRRPGRSWARRRCFPRWAWCSRRRWWGRSATLRWGFLCSRAFWWARSSARPTRLRCSSSCAPKSSASNTTPPRSWKWRAAATTPALTCSPPSCSRSWWAALRPGRRFISSFRRWCTAGRWAWPAGCLPCGSCGAFPSAPRGLNRSLPWRWRCFPTPCPRPWAGTATSARILRASCSATRTSSTSRRWCPFLTASPI